MSAKADPGQQGLPLTLRFRPFGGEDAEMDALAFAAYLTETIRALRQMADLIGHRDVTVNYNVSALRKQSPAVIELTPRVMLSDLPIVVRAQKEHVRVIGAIQGGVLPEFLDYPTLLTYRKLGDIARRERFVADVQANGSMAESGPQLKAKLDLEFAKDRFSEGGMRGWIRSYHTAGKRRLIRLYPRVGPHLTCQFSEKDQAKVRNLVEDFVEVSGRMRYRPNEYHPYFMEIKRITSLETGASVPTFGDMEGFAPGITGGKSVEAFVREQRNGW